MICGTASNAGKTTLVVGVCRLLARRGLRVAPFKAQNMALNSAVTASGHEIGRAQYLQAQAAGVEATTDMNPILLKPTGEHDSQVVVEGLVQQTMSAAEYHRHKPELLERVLACLHRLRASFDAVVLEGAGSPAEINLADNDIVNLRIAERAKVPAVVVGDIDLGGVFASLMGTVSLLPPAQRRLVKGFVINKFRGDSALLGDGLEELERRCGVPTLGVIPMLADLRLDAEDSVALSAVQPPKPDARLDVAVIAFPRLSNFTDIDPLAAESDVAVRFVRSAPELGRPDLIVLGGTKTTVDDLAWMQARGIADAVAASGAVVLGICGGYQMLGHRIHDEYESGSGTVPGLGLLDVETVFEGSKVLARRRGTALGVDVGGYQIHHGRVRRCGGGSSMPWLLLGGEAEGFRNGRVMGTSLHGVFESDEFRRAFLRHVADQQATGFTPSPGSFADQREAEFDRVADTLETHLDLDALGDIMGVTL